MSKESLDEKLQLFERHREIVAQRNILLNACKSAVTNMYDADKLEELWIELGEAINEVEGPDFMWYRPNPFYKRSESETTNSGVSK